MIREQKINYIKCWLQKFGNRDNETFNIEVDGWEISYQYDFDIDGNQIEPYGWCRSSFKHVHNNQFSDRTNEELEEIVNKLKSKKSYY